MAAIIPSCHTAFREYPDLRNDLEWCWTCRPCVLPIECSQHPMILFQNVCVIE